MYLWWKGLCYLLHHSYRTRNAPILFSKGETCIEHSVRKFWICRPPLMFPFFFFFSVTLSKLHHPNRAMQSLLQRSGLVLIRAKSHLDSPVSMVPVQWMWSPGLVGCRGSLPRALTLASWPWTSLGSCPQFADSASPSAHPGIAELKNQHNHLLADGHKASWMNLFLICPHFE